MSKRARTLESLANLPYTTIDGGRWLKKALDPADIDVEISGLPDINTNPRTVLNYQYQSDIPLPSPTTYNNNIVQSYDANLYLYQNPIIFGMSVSYPAGSIPLQGGQHLFFSRDRGIVTLDSTVSPVNAQVFYNSQIEGDSLEEKTKSLEKYCQKYRLIYGGVQCIPACSALFDSGTIEATQQIFSPKEELNSDETDLYNDNDTGEVYKCQTYNENDFPDKGEGIQNPTTLYCRYKEGLYMPYKFRNPLVYPYTNSEDRVVNEAPYYITSEAHVEFKSNETTTVKYALTFNPEERAFTCPNVTIPQDKIVRWIFRCVSKTGVFFNISVNFTASSQTTQLVTLPEKLAVVDHPVFATTSGPFYAVQVFCNDDYPEMEGMIGTPLLPKMNECNIGVVCFRSIGLQATVRVIFRIGVEMLITAGGIYSPFKHKAPKYDQRALSTYARVVHLVRDAFLGNAATPEGHPEFSMQLAAAVAYDDTSATSNLGSGWYGRVSV